MARITSSNERSPLPDLRERGAKAHIPVDHQPVALRDHERVTGSYKLAIGEQFAAEQRLRATQRLAALGEMTGGIAHDFRNLLSVIESGLRLAEGCSEEPASMRAYIAAAREGIDRGIELTSQLLAFAKHQKLEAHAGDVNEFLRDFEPFLRYGAGSGIRIVLEFGSNIPKCLLDPAQFDSAILNLVVNARDAMPNGGEIRIRTERLVLTTAKSGSPPPGTYARVRVKDCGHGMTPEVLQRVFDPFFTTKGEKGTGMGLPHVSAFMQLIGGYVTISSERGVGTTFDLIFPSAQPDELS